MISSTETSPRERFWPSVASSLLERSTTSVRSWSLRSLRFATSTVRSCDGQLGEARVAGLRAELDDDEQAEDEGHGRDRELAAASVHGQPPGALLGVVDGPADGEAIGRE